MKKIITTLLTTISLVSYPMEEENSHSYNSFQASKFLKIASASSEYYLDSPLKTSSDHECPESVLSVHMPHEIPMDTEYVFIKSELMEEPYNAPTSLIPSLLACMQIPIQAQQTLEISLEKIPMQMTKDDDYASKARNKRIIKKLYNSPSSRLRGKYKCPECDHVLSYTWGLKSHINRVHGNLPKWGCPFLNDNQTHCHTTFITNSDYRKHLKKKHLTDYIKSEKLGLKKVKLVAQQNESNVYKSIATTPAHRPITRSTTGSLKAKAQ